MAKITFNSQDTGFSMWLDEVVSQSSERSVDYLYFSTPNKYKVTLFGGPFAYTSKGVPASGTVGPRCRTRERLWRCRRRARRTGSLCICWAC